MQYYASLSASYISRFADNFHIIMKSGRLHKVVKLMEN